MASGCSKGTPGRAYAAVFILGVPLEGDLIFKLGVVGTLCRELGAGVSRCQLVEWFHECFHALDVQATFSALLKLSDLVKAIRGEVRIHLNININFKDIKRFIWGG